MKNIVVAVDTGTHMFLDNRVYRRSYNTYTLKTIPPEYHIFVKELSTTQKSSICIPLPGLAIYERIL